MQTAISFRPLHPLYFLRSLQAHLHRPPRPLPHTRLFCTSPSLTSLLSPPDLLRLCTLLTPLTEHLRSRHTTLLSKPSLRPAQAAELRSLSPLSDALSTSAALQAELSDVSKLHTEATAAGDTDLVSLAEDEKRDLEAKLSLHAATLISSLLERHRMAEQPALASGSSAILELRAGTGGDEAALFVGDLAEMYTRLCARRGWRTRELSRSAETRAGGLRELIVRVSGAAVTAQLGVEAGVHRVQRVPATETQGRVHTSTASVAVLSDDVGAAKRVVLADGDVKVDVYRASGAGGQHVNKTESAVRVTHLRTGLIATSQDERSQHRNRAIAMESLAARIAAQEAGEAAAKRVAERRLQLGATAGERSDRIRTYNFPQRRVTDHRVVVGEGLKDVLADVQEVVGDKWAGLDGVLEGGPELERLMGSVMRVRELQALQEVMAEARQVCDEFDEREDEVLGQGQGHSQGHSQGPDQGPDQGQGQGQGRTKRKRET